jgi:hypothetical protein
MHGFIASPALAKLVALQMVDEELHKTRRRGRARVSVRSRLLARRTSDAKAPAPRQRVSASGQLVEESR